MKHLFALLFLGITFSISAQVRTVTNLNNAGPGSLRSEVANSYSGDIIQFSSTLLANGSDTLKLDSAIHISHSLTIKGLMAAGDTLYINGQDTTQIFIADSGLAAGTVDLKLEDLAVVRGKSHSNDAYLLDQHGGAVSAIFLRSLVIQNSVFRECKTSGVAHAGAVYVSETDSFLISDTKFERNSSSGVVTGNNNNRGLGGAVHANRTDTWIYSSVFTGNSTRRHGGAFSQYQSDLYCFSTKFVGNSAFRNGGVGAPLGGAIYQITDGESALIVDCQFVGNIGKKSGAVYSVSYVSTYSEVEISGCLFEGNYSYSEGGAVYNLGRDLRIENSSFLKNTARIDGGGIYSTNHPSLEIQRSSFLGDTALNNGSAMWFGGQTEDLRYVTATPGNNTSLIYSSSNDTSYLRHCILSAHQGKATATGSVVWHTNTFNIFSNAPSYANANDQVNVDTATLDLEPISYYNGIMPIRVPGLNSPALNTGRIVDYSDAQNGPIFGRRDIGAAERQVIVYDTTYSCDTASWWGTTYTSHGTYMDTAYNANTIDSVGVLVFERYQQNFTVSYIDTLLIAQAQDSGTTYQWIYCDGSNTPISGATDSIYQPTANGSYAVVLTNGNCIDTSACVAVTGIGLMEHNPQDQWVRFYPNPTSGILQVDSDVELSSLQVFDLSGREVALYNMKGQTQISLHELKSGLYLLKWEDIDGRVQVDRVEVKGF